MCHTPKTLTLQVVRECHQQRIHPNNFSKDSCGHQGLPYSGKEHTIDLVTVEKTMRSLIGQNKSHTSLPSSVWATEKCVAYKKSAHFNRTKKQLC